MVRDDERVFSQVAITGGCFSCSTGAFFALFQNITCFSFFRKWFRQYYVILLKSFPGSGNLRNFLETPTIPDRCSTKILYFAKMQL